MSESYLDERIVFPFTAVVDQDLLKLALILNAINPKIGGLLVRGEKGSGKSTVVRALADLLPEIKVVKGCPFNCNPEDPTNMCSVCRERFERGEELPVEKRKMKVITLPIGATEDRVIGSLDIERALKEGVKALQPGILAEANQNILYVDEINLLPDHIVDDILDAAASGWNIIEREGISIAHPSRFILVGTMNPEEGELRPQLLDRLPLSVTIRGIQDEQLRVEVIKRNLEFAEDPLGFRRKYEKKQRELRERILKAIELLPNVRVPNPILKAVAKLCLALQVDGHRPDIIIVQTARTLAAFQGRTIVEPEDINVAAKLALGHRTRRGGFEEPASLEEIDKVLEKVLGMMKQFFRRQEKRYILKKSDNIMERERAISDAKGEEEPGLFVEKPSKFQRSSDLIPFKEIKGSKVPKIFRRGGFPSNREARSNPFTRAVESFKTIWKRKLSKNFLLRRKSEENKEKVMVEIASTEALLIDVTKKTPLIPGEKILEKLKSCREVFKPQFSVKAKEKKGRCLSGKNALAITSVHKGRIVGYQIPKRPTTDIALGPTIRAAALRQIRSGKKLTMPISSQDLRTNIRMYKAPLTILIVLDLSESMVFHLRTVAKAVLSLHRKAYRYRDRVGLIVLQGDRARVVFHPTTNINIVARKIIGLKAGGTTPLADGLFKVVQVLTQEMRRNPDTIPMIVLISDGLANVPLKHQITKFLDERSLITAQSDVIAATRLLARKRIPIVVINSLHFDKWESDLIISPTLLLIWIAQITGGRYYGFRTGLLRTTLTVERMIGAIEKAIKNIVHA